MAHTCRGTINLANAFIHTEDSNTIVISNSGSSTYYLKATSEVERQKWVTALELAKAEAVKMQDTGKDLKPHTLPWSKNILILYLNYSHKCARDRRYYRISQIVSSIYTFKRK